MEIVEIYIKQNLKHSKLDNHTIVTKEQVWRFSSYNLSK